MNTDIPQVIKDGFPELLRATFVRSLASAVPLVPDTIFGIYATNEGKFLILVKTDYPDPLLQSKELKAVSGQYEFEFESLLVPFRNNEFIKIREHDDMDENFSITDSAVYYYVAGTRRPV